MKIKLILFFITIIFFSSCDLLRTSVFEIVSWSPGGGFHSQTENIIISIAFSHEPDKSNLEHNFSLNGNSNRIKGYFNWNGNTMFFIPLSPLEINTDYTIIISADAHDTEGLSLDKEFKGDFTTRPDDTRPVLFSIFPSMYEEISDLKTKVKLFFSSPVPLISLYDNIAFNPSMTGIWQLQDEDRLAVFTPSEPWTLNSIYEIRVSSSLSDNNGMTIGKEQVSVFTAGRTSEKPYLENASRILKNGSVIILNPDNGYSGAVEQPVENTDIEKDDKFLFVFSKPVDSALVKNNISIENGPALIMETLPGFNDTFIFKFENTPEYNSRFTVKIKKGIKDISNNETENDYTYKFYANGKYSKPPELAGIRIPLAPNNETNQELIFYDTYSLFDNIRITDNNYPSGEAVKTWIELYFETAQDAAVNLFSLMELFQTETSNNVISFSARKIKNNNFTILEPHEEKKDFIRIEIEGELTNTTNFGIIYFQITAGLLDSLGNKNNNLQRIPLQK